MTQTLVQYFKGKSLALGRFGPEVSTASVATRHYWNTWDLLQVKNGVLMRCFIRCDATGNHLQLLVTRSLHVEVLQHVHIPHLGDTSARKR